MNNNINCKENTIFYPLTHAQKRVWYTENIYPDMSIHNIGGPIRIKGAIDFNKLEECINIFISRNEGLRLRFIEENGEVYQYVSDYEPIKLDFVDFSQYEQPETEFKKWVENEARKPFQFKNNRLFYFALFKISDNDNGYLAKFHHIISDGWSINIMTENISSVYMKFLNKEEINDTYEHSYIEYIEDEKNYLSSDRFIKNKLFWNEKFKPLPDEILKKSSDSLEGKRKTYELDLDLSSKIKKFAKDNKYSLNTFFVALYLFYLNKAIQQSDIIIGTPVLNRSGKKQKSIFGMFTSTMPFRFTIDEEATVLESITEINAQLKNYYFNQKYPYNLLVQDLELKKKGCDNLFDVCVNYYNTKLGSELNGSAIENLEFYNGNQIFSMQLVIKDWCSSGRLTLDFDYKVNDYTAEQIDDIYRRLINLTNQIVSNPCEKISTLSLIAESEKKELIYEFNNTNAEYPKDKVIYTIFEEHVDRTPNKIAVSYGDIKLTYRELNEKANQLARLLDKKGIGKDKIVGLLTLHSIETVIGILGVIKAGGAYLPIDPDYPAERVGYMLEDSGTDVLLTNYDVTDIGSFRGKIINLEDPSLYTGENSNLNKVNNTDDLVYVIYTSGSTGKPKGTMIEHQGLVNYIWWAKQMYVKNENEVFPLYSSLAFDLTVTSVFTPLISGNSIVIYRDNEDEYVLYRIMKEKKATVVKLTPAHLALLKDLDNKNSSVKRFIVGGEDLKVNLAKSIHESFNGDIEIFNEYGPTETVVGCMIHKYDYENDVRASVPIGVPAHNVQIYILDNKNNPVPVGTIGEMFISGDGVARGYLNRADLTQRKFIENPFLSGKKMYRTGDLARFLNDGKIEYVGRSDHQVKIRGYRIELGEIEKHLENHPAIREAVVIDHNDVTIGKYLCAYIVTKSDITPYDLKDYLSGNMPQYMVPTYFVELDEIPLTQNGKVNRASLPQPDLSENRNCEYVASRTEKEEVLIKHISEVLNIDRISVRDNFYHLGGDSIKAIQIASKLSNEGFKLKVKDIMAHPVLEELALCIEQTKSSVIDQSPCKGSIKSTPIATWFFSQSLAEPGHYTQSVLLKLDKGVSEESLNIVLNKLISQHDSLRINYNFATGELYYNEKHLNKDYSLEAHDLSALPKHNQYEEIARIGEGIKSSFDIENDILIKACLFNLGANGKHLLLTAHHLVVDGVSWRIILDDVYISLKQIENGLQLKLPLKTDSLQKWAEILEMYSTGEMYKEKEYWDEILNRKITFSVQNQQTDYYAEHNYELSVHIGEEETQMLVLNANTPYNTEPKDLLIAALARALNEIWGNEEVVIELEGHGREDIFENIDVTRTVGWFTSIYPVHIKMNVNDLPSHIKGVKEQLRSIPNNGIGYSILKHLAGCLKDDREKYIRFNFMGDFGNAFKNEFFELLDRHSGNEVSKKNQLTCLLDINCIIIDGRLKISIAYSRDKFTDTTITELIDKYSDNLKEIIGHCCNKETVEFTPSDFDAAEISQDELELLFS
ncbi:MAG: amino acid adenylation domain-containing protein [Clostridia bacterium]|nr:amino acid adenylation domain-containing protein [Clostridia bacterium]